ncbi:MaoC family dehydratase [Saccharothrix texasensis]|uniref:MaoC dehydratase-like protein n=1 Tax=Saccharothrix texasensis TaxID=103734 RepID=A0A3N1GXV1_9PSEU|nr:MaoC family dehydratase [Saccharothrix texasensis]ROP34936.1 MaoC dehydratase-like protein [Saccharothrix texasensis]
MRGKPLGARRPDSILERSWNPALIAEFDRCTHGAVGARPARTPPIVFLASLSLDLDPLVRLLGEAGSDLAAAGAVHVGEEMDVVTDVQPEGRCVVTTGVRLVKPTAHGSVIGLVAVAETAAGLPLWRKRSTVHAGVRLPRLGSAPLTRLACAAREASGEAWTVPKSFPNDYSRFGDHNPLHLDDAVAHAAGFDRRPAHGLGLVAVALTAPDRRARAPRRLRAAFRRPVLVDDTVRFTAVAAGTGAEHIGISTDTDPEPAIVVVTEWDRYGRGTELVHTEETWTY